MELISLKLDRLILLKTKDRLERGEIVALARSIAKYGILVPITVKKILNTDRYEIISGAKRFYACRIARMSYIPAYVIDVPAQLARVIIKKGEQQDLFDEAEAIRTVMLNEDLSAEELSEKTGYTGHEVIGMLRSTKMGEFERELVRRNNVERESVWEIATSDDICKRTDLLCETIRSRLKPIEVKRLCERGDKNKLPVLKNPQRTPKFKDMRLFDNTLSRAVTMLKDAGVKANILSEQKNGGVEYKIRIEN